MWTRRKLHLPALPLLRRASPPSPHPLPIADLWPIAHLRSRPSLLRPDSPDRRLCWHILPESRVSRSSAFSTVGASSCWKCGSVAASPGPFLACGSCGSAQPVDSSVDYFQIFGLERVYDIEEDSLERKYKDWQKKLHPDLSHSKSENEKAFAAEQSARVIDAYHTLRRPLSRALYLLELQGIQVDEERTVTDPDLLVEMMDIRESVEDVNDSEALKEIQSKVQIKLKEWSNSFCEAFNRRDHDAAVTCTQRMRYYERAIEEIVKKL